MIARTNGCRRSWINNGATGRNHPNRAVETRIDGEIGIERSLDAIIDGRHQMRVWDIFTRWQLGTAFAEIKLEVRFGNRKGHRESNWRIRESVIVQPVDRVILTSPQ